MDNNWKKITLTNLAVLVFPLLLLTVFTYNDPGGGFAYGLMFAIVAIGNAIIVVNIIAGLILGATSSDLNRKDLGKKMALFGLACLLIGWGTCFAVLSH